MTLTNKMFIHVAVFAFLFLAGVRFLKSKSIAEVIQSRYCENTVKRIQKLEQLNYCLRKAELDLHFLSKCDNSNVIPNFLIFLIFHLLIKSIKRRNPSEKVSIKKLRNRI